MQRLCDQHGANYTGQLKMNECTHLIGSEPSGKLAAIPAQCFTFCQNLKTRLSWKNIFIESLFNVNNNQPGYIVACALVVATSNTGVFMCVCRSEVRVCEEVERVLRVSTLAV